MFDGAEIDFGALRDAIKAPPMMADYKLVEWRYADFEHMREGARGALEELAKARGDYPYTVLAFLASEEGFDPGTPKRPSKLYTRLSGTLEILNFTKSTPAQLLSWLAKHFEAEGVRAGADALGALLFRSGHSMRVLLNEVSKLSAYVKANGRDTLTVRDVEQISVSNPECDAFALTNAITDRDLPGALRALEDMKRRRVEPAAVLGMMSRTFAELLSVSLLLEEGRDAQDIAALLKINPYKIKIYMAAARRRTPASLQEAMETLLRADADSKSGGVSGWCAVESFVAQNT